MPIGAVSISHGIAGPSRRRRASAKPRFSHHKLCEEGSGGTRTLTGGGSFAARS